MNSGFFPIVLQHKERIQTESQQIPFYFGGSSVPNNLNLKHSQYSGSGFNMLKPKKQIRNSLHNGNNNVFIRK